LAAGDGELLGAELDERRLALLASTATLSALRLLHPTLEPAIVEAQGPTRRRHPLDACHPRRCLPQILRDPLLRSLTVFPPLLHPFAQGAQIFHDRSLHGHGLLASVNVATEPGGFHAFLPGEGSTQRTQGREDGSPGWRHRQLMDAPLRHSARRRRGGLP